MVDKAKNFFPNFLKEKAGNMKEPLARLEKAIEKARARLEENVEKIDAGELRKLYDELLDWIRTSRGEVEHFFGDRLEKALAALKLPSREEVEELKKQVASLSKIVSGLDQAKSAPMAKKAVKKPVKKGKK